MSERPIIFSGESVRAILAGTKTQTRRVLTVPWHNGKRRLPWSPYYEDENGVLFVRDDGGDYIAMQDTVSPYGQVGTKLWVREAWRPTMVGLSCGINYAADDCTIDYVDRFDELVWLIQDGGGNLPTPGAAKHLHTLRWRPSIFMPRWASRITLELTAVRVERLHAIDDDGAIAEGCEGSYTMTPQEQYAALWDDINGKRAPWASNCWVWVLEFRRVKP